MENIWQSCKWRACYIGGDSMAVPRMKFFFAFAY